MKLIVSLTLALFVTAPALFGQNTLLWRISGHGLSKPSYLYGTMHFVEEGLYHFSDSAVAAFNRAEAYAMEVLMDPAAQMKASMAFQVKDEKYSLKKTLKKKRYALVEKALKQEMGTSLAAFDRFQPVFVYLMLAEAPLMKKMTEAMLKGIQPLDLHLMKEASNRNKKLVGLETIEEQAAVLTGEPLKTQAEQLAKFARKVLDDPEKAHGEHDTLMALYLKQDLAGIQRMVDEEKDMSGEAKEALIFKRNQLMADRMEPLLREQSTFVAVGAAHLPGPTGVLELLRKKGYTVTGVVRPPQPDNELLPQAYRRK